MLYLNTVTVSWMPVKVYLTLTSVVFEFFTFLVFCWIQYNLTLTSVVFEFGGAKFAGRKYRI